MYRQTKGFTLIELIIVMSIASLLIGLVGPLAINNLERAQAKQELLSVKRWLKKISIRAFSTGKAHQVSLKGKKLTLFTFHQEKNTQLATKELEYLFFQPQELDYATNGFVNKSFIKGTFRERPMNIELAEFINGQQKATLD